MPFSFGPLAGPSSSSTVIPPDRCQACHVPTANAPVEVVGDGSGICVALCDACLPTFIWAPGPAA